MVNDAEEMENIKEAIESARIYAKTLVDDKLRNFEVDEISYSEDFWIISLKWKILKKKPQAKTPIQEQLQLLESKEYYGRLKRVF
jgi:hypothetical protein